MAIRRPPEKTRTQRYLPIVEWLPNYDWAENIRWDVIAGLTVWALLIPEAMAYAGIAGVPPQAGLYAAPFALLGYAVFGSSRHLFVGPSSTVAIVSASVVGGIVAAGTDDFWTVSIWLALVTGVVMVVLGVVRMGWVANFLAQPVLDGFIVGLAIVIAVGQLDKMFGIEKSGDNTLQELGSIIRQWQDWHWATIAVGFGSLALLYALHAFVPKIPAALVVVVLAIAASASFGFEDSGIHIVGDIPAGMPGFPIPGLPDGMLMDLVLGSLAIIVVAYAESLAAAQSYARKHGYSVDANQELIGLGFANIGAGMLQGFVVDGSLSKTAAGDEAGQKTQMTGLFAGALSLVTILFLTGLFFHLPEATLGAIVVHAVAKLIGFRKLKQMWNVRRADFYAAIAALGGVLLIDILQGIMIGIALSLLMLIRRASFPTASRLGAITVDGRTTYVSASEFDHAKSPSGIVVHRFNADLIFSNSGAFVSSVMEMIYDTDPAAFAVVIDCEQMADMDMTGSDRLLTLVKTLQANGIDIRLARLHGSASAIAERSGITRAVHVDHIHATVAAAVSAAAESQRSQVEPTAE